MHHRGANSPTTTRSRFSFFRFPRRRRALGPRATVVDFNQANDGTTGTIPLSPQRSAEKPPRYATIFGWGTHNSSGNSQVAAPQNAARPAHASGSSGNRSPTSNGYGYGQGYENWNPYLPGVDTYGYNGHSGSNENPFHGNGWQSADTPGYNYGASGVADNRYAYGYGDSQPGPTPYAARPDF